MGRNQKATDIGSHRTLHFLVDIRITLDTLDTLDSTRSTGYQQEAIYPIPHNHKSYRFQKLLGQPWTASSYVEPLANPLPPSPIPNPPSPSHRRRRQGAGKTPGSTREKDAAERRAGIRTGDLTFFLSSAMVINTSLPHSLQPCHPKDLSPPT
jgi:hypothetical protein